MGPLVLCGANITTSTASKVGTEVGKQGTDQVEMSRQSSQRKCHCQSKQLQQRDYGNRPQRGQSSCQHGQYCCNRHFYSYRNSRRRNGYDLRSRHRETKKFCPSKPRRAGQCNDGHAAQPGLLDQRRQHFNQIPTYFHFPNCLFCRRNLFTFVSSFPSITSIGGRKSNKRPWPFNSRIDELSFGK